MQQFGASVLNYMRWKTSVPYIIISFWLPMGQKLLK